MKSVRENFPVSGLYLPIPDIVIVLFKGPSLRLPELVPVMIQPVGFFIVPVPGIRIHISFPEIRAHGQFKYFLSALFSIFDKAEFGILIPGSLGSFFPLQYC
jgi:hypothetical protein